MTIDSMAQAAWAPADFPYQCLVDTRRTEAFRSAIRETVHAGDVVVDAGSGSGILAFFAARAGASRVYAVEIDPVLASWLERSVRANGLADTVHVICGDIGTVRLPTAVDVGICEMLDTGLLDETQVLVLNQLRARGVFSESTRLIPERYETFVELGAAALDCYGFRVLLPAHRWPQHADPESGWLPMRFQPFSPRTRVASVDFRRLVGPRLYARFSFVCVCDGEINAIRVSGCAHLTSRISLGPTNAFNGDKIVPIDPLRVRPGQVVHVEVRGQCGQGLDSLAVETS
jgi:SAM-dependent methyltransferase